MSVAGVGQIKLVVMGAETNVVMVVVDAMPNVGAVVNMELVVVGTVVMAAVVPGAVTNIETAVVVVSGVVVAVVVIAVSGERRPSRRNLASRLLFSSTVPVVSKQNLPNSTSSSSFFK